MKKRTRALAASLASAVTAAFGLLLVLAPSAHAASLVQITNFGSNPGNSKMYLYVPTNVQAHPAILVAAHQCTGTGPGFYSSTEFASLADRYGFIVIYPDANRSGQCWDVSSNAALTHNGSSDPADIASMVQYVEQHNNADSSRVYITGASSGAMLTDVLLGDYPDIFKAGAAFMGVPFHCFYTGTVDGWNSACANGQVSNTPQTWGDYVRAAYPGYSGPRPRVQLWHGTNDGTLNYNNFGEEIKQWTNVLAVSQTPSSTSTLNGTWTHTTYGNATDPTVDAYSIAGTGHVLPQSGMAAIAIHFFALDGSTPPTSPPPTSTSPTPTASPTPSTGGGGSCTATLSAGTVGSNWYNLNVAVSGSNTWTVTMRLVAPAVVYNTWNVAASWTSQYVMVAKPNGSGNNFGVTISTNGQWTWPSVSCSTS